ERKRLAARRDLTSEERGRLDLFLKLVANALYGITAEVNRRADPQPVTLHGLSSFTSSSDEEPGRFFFAPQAALTTGGARLMLALAERLTRDRGGGYAMCDTDSLTIVSSTRGGLVPCPGGNRSTPTGEDAVLALSHADVDAIRADLNALNPYDPA